MGTKDHKTSEVKSYVDPYPLPKDFWTEIVAILVSQSLQITFVSPRYTCGKDNSGIFDFLQGLLMIL